MGSEQELACLGIFTGRVSLEVSFDEDVVAISAKMFSKSSSAAANIFFKSSSDESPLAFGIFEVSVAFADERFACRRS